MTSLIGARKRAEEFAAALAGEAAWSDVHPELADLAGIVETLQAVEPVSPSQEFTTSLRERLMAEAEKSAVQDRVLTLPPRRRARERRFALAASALVFVGGTAGMAAAAQQALPGDALYPIKRGLEKAQAGFATSDEAKGHDLLGQADTRLGEIQEIVGGSSSSAQLPETIDAFTAQAVAGSNLLIGSYEQSEDADAIRAVRTFTGRDLRLLQQLAGQAPPAQQEELTHAALALLKIDKKAVRACESCAKDIPALEMPSMFRVSADVTRALHKAQHDGRTNGLNNDHPVLPQDTASQPKDEQPATGDGDQTGDGTSGSEDQQLPGLPSGDGGGDTSGGTGGDGGPVRDTVKGVTGGSLLPEGDDDSGLIGTLLP